MKLNSTELFVCYSKKLYPVRMNLADRIKMCRESLGLSQEKVAEIIGISQPSYQRLEKGLVKNPKYLNELANIYKTTPKWLLFDGDNPPEYLKNYNAVPEGKVPLLEWSVVQEWIGSFDLAALISHSNSESRMVRESSTPYLTMHLEFIAIPEKKNNRQFALKVKDDSMVSPTSGKRSFLEGNIIVIDPEAPYRNGDYIIALKDKEAFFSQYTTYGGNQFLKPLNPQYPLIPIDETVKICGVVTAYLDVLT